MDVQVQSRVVQRTQRLPFEVVALVLRGGGALGAHQAAVYEAPTEVGICPNRIAGMSIGAINAAINAGNAPNHLVDRLREFWTQMTPAEPRPGAGNTCLDFARGDAVRQLLNKMSVGFAAASGAEDSSRHVRWAVFFSPPIR
jgi:NTE family protein